MQPAALLVMVVALACSAVLEAEIPRFVFTGLPAAATNETAFFLTIEARDIVGARRTDISGPHRLAAYRRPWAGLIITELGERVELANAGTEPLDVQGYSLVLKYGSERLTELYLPSGRIVGPGEVLVLPEAGSGLNIWPDSRDIPLNAILLKNPAGRTMDEVVVGFGASSEFWTGSPLLGASSRSGAQRVGSELRYSAREWQRFSPPTMGVANPLLTVPRGGWRTPARITPESIVFTNGVWSGLVAVAAPPGLITASVDDGGGRISESDSIALVPLPPLVLAVAEMAASASEVAPGTFARLRVTRPNPVASAVVVRLRSDYPGEIGVPESVIIPAGQASATFAITNFDDSIPDGRALVKITASASGMNDGLLELTNDDDEPLMNFVVMPSQVLEGSGRSPIPGWVYRDAPSTHPVVVLLSTTNTMLQLPDRVIIPAGMQAADFSFVVGNDTVVNSLRGAVLVNASFREGNVASTAVWIIDNEFSGWGATYPETVLEGSSSEIILDFSYASDVPRRVGIIAPPPWIVTGETSLPAGTTNLSFSLLYPTNGVRNSEAPPRVLAWVDTPPAAGADPALFRQIDVIDKEPVISDVTWDLAAMLEPGTPAPVRIVLADGNHPAFINTTGQLRILTSGGAVRFETGETMPALFTNGVFEGILILRGSEIGIEFELSAAGVTRRFGPVAAVEQWSPEGVFFDIAAIPGKTGLLAGMNATNGSGGRLVEIDPDTRAVVRELALARAPIKIAVTPDGSAAWCGDADGTVRRVDLTLWQAGEDVSVKRNSGSPFPLYYESLLAMGGPSDRLIAATTENIDGFGHIIQQFMAFENGVRLAGSRLESFPPWYQNRIRDLAAGPTVNSFYIIDRDDSYVSMMRVTFDDGGVNYSPIFSSYNRIGVDSTVVANGPLWVGSSLINQDTLQETRPSRNPNFANPESVAFFSRTGKMAVVAGSQVTVFGSSDGRFLGAHALDGEFSAPDRMLGTAAVGNRWLARLVGRSGGGRLLLCRSPLLADDGAPADIAIRIVETGASENGEKTVEVLNLGPGPARGCQVEIRNAIRTNTVEYGYLPAGASRTNRVPMPHVPEGVSEVILTSSAFSTDPDLTNNTIRMPWVIYPDGVTNMRPVFVQVQHMVVSTDGNKLYAGVRQLPEGAGAGVVEIDPSAGVITRAVAVEDPRRLEVAGADALLVRSGEEQLMRWNLASGTITPEITITNVVFFDFVAIPGDPDRVVVGTPDGISMYRRGALLAKAALMTTERRVIAVARDRIWSAFQRGVETVPFTVDSFGPSTYDAAALWTPRDLIPAGDLLYLATWGVSASINLNDRRFRSVNLPTIVVPDVAQNAVFGWSNGIVRLEEAAYSRTAHQPLRFPTTNQMTMLLRWGERGFAMTDAEGYLHLFESDIVRPRSPGLNSVASSGTESYDDDAPSYREEALEISPRRIRSSVANSAARAGLEIIVVGPEQPLPAFLLLDAACGVGDPLVFGLSSPYGSPVSVSYLLESVSLDGQHTNSQPGVLEFAPGQTTINLNSGMFADALLSNGSRARITVLGGLPNLPAAFDVQIDATRLRRISAVEVSLDEGDDGILEAVVPVVLSPTAPVPVEVGYEIAMSGGTTNLAAGRLRFQPGQATNYVSFPVEGNRVFERDRWAQVRLFQPWNAILRGDATSVVNIIENDPIQRPGLNLKPGDGSALSLGFTSDFHVYYRIQYTTNVATGQWMELEPLTGVSGPLELPLETGDSMRFYRVLAQ